MVKYTKEHVKVNPNTTIWYYYHVDNKGKKTRISEREYRRKSGDKWKLGKFKRSQPHEWTSQRALNRILEEYASQNDRHRLVVCHGNLHRKLDYIPSYEKAILLDRNPYVEPDVLGSFVDMDFVHRFPKEFFQEIYTAHCGMGYISKNKNMWKAFDYLLSSGGKVFLDVIIFQFSLKYPKDGINELKRRIREHLSDFYRKVEFKDVELKKNRRVSHPTSEKKEVEVRDFWTGMVIATK